MRDKPDLLDIRQVGRGAAGQARPARRPAGRARSSRTSPTHQTSGRSGEARLHWNVCPTRQTSGRSGELAQSFKCWPCTRPTCQRRLIFGRLQRLPDPPDLRQVGLAPRVDQPPPDPPDTRPSPGGRRSPTSTSTHNFNINTTSTSTHNFDINAQLQHQHTTSTSTRNFNFNTQLQLQHTTSTFQNLFVVSIKFQHLTNSKFIISKFENVKCSQLKHNT